MFSVISFAILNGHHEWHLAFFGTFWRREPVHVSVENLTVGYCCVAVHSIQQEAIILLFNGGFGYLLQWFEEQGGDGIVFALVSDITL